MKKLTLIFFMFAVSLCAQDTIRFTNGVATPVKVNEIGETEIKYNRWDNITGPVYVVAKSEVRYIRYVNGMKDTFAIAKPKVDTPVAETPTKEFPIFESPGYVNTPVTPSNQQIVIVRKKLFYDHRALNDKALLSLIRKHPDQGMQNLMLKDFSKISGYKNNRTIGLFLLYGGIATSFISLSANSPTGFLLGTAAGISGSIIAIVNKNKRYAKRIQVARTYNNSFQ
mgnify:CR=1 FL=1